MSYSKAGGLHDEISLWLTYSTLHNPAEKKKSISHSTKISINYIQQLFAARQKSITVGKATRVLNFQIQRLSFVKKVESVFEFEIRSLLVNY